MNWQTEDILKEAKRQISDKGVFSEDQINKFTKLIDFIGRAIDRESDCNKPSVKL